MSSGVTSDRAEETRARAERARRDNAAGIFQIESAMLGKIRAYSIFAEEFRPQ